MRLFVVALALVLGLSSGSAVAAKWKTIGDALAYAAEQPKAKEFVMQTLVDMQIGMSWSNSAHTVAGERALYCVPENLQLNGEALFVIIQRVGGKQPFALEDPIGNLGAFLLTSLMDTFPCKK
jgi:hypothetical protein